MTETFISYSQNGEDIVLWRALKGVENGFYIDVGAADPIGHSATYALYLRDWRGINIEPVHDFAEALRTLRPRDITLEMALGDEAGELTAYVVEGTGLTTLDKDRADELSGDFDVRTRIVPTATLASVCAEHVPPGQPVHILKVDVEGFERQVLQGADFETFRPWVIVIEATRPSSQIQSHEEWEPILLEAGYSYCSFDGLNRYYVATEHSDLAEALSYGPSVFDRPYQPSEVTLGIERHREHILTELHSTRKQADELERDLASARDEYSRLRDTVVAEHQAELDRMGEQLDRLANELADVTGVRDRAFVALETAQRERSDETDELRRLRGEVDLARRQLQGMYDSETWRIGRLIWHVGRRTGLAEVARRPAQQLLGRVFGETTDAAPGRRGIAGAIPGRRGATAGPWDFPSTHTWEGPLADLADELSTGVVPEPDRLHLAIDELAMDSDDAIASGRFSYSERRALGELQLALKGRSHRSAEPGLVVIDARCFDDPALAHRGIGRHALDVLGQLAGSVADASEVILVGDGGIDSLSPRPDLAWTPMSAAEFVRSHRTADLFVSLSPVTAPVIPSAIGHDTRAIAIVYDLIPLAYPRHYHADPASFVEYVGRLSWLRTFDGLWSISAATIDDLVDRLDIDRARAEFTGVSYALRSDATEGTNATAPVVMVCGGGEPRKNMLTPIEAMRRSHLDVDVEIMGVLPEQLADPLVEIGSPRSRRSLTLLGRVSDDELAAAYRRAAVVVVPSHAEGFSLPVAEALEAGRPVVASAIPEHRELLGEGPWLVDPRERKQWAVAVKAALRNADEWHRRQDETYRHSVSRRWDPAQYRFEATRRRSTRRRRQRPTLAIVTPLPPQRTGIADYSAFVFPALERYFDVGYVVNSLDEVAAGIGPRRDETITTGLVGRFDHVLHVLGNSHFHVPALEHLQRLGGAALGHDNRMSGAYLHWRGAAATARVMSMHGADIAEPDVYRYLVDLDGAPDSCYGEIAEWARPLFVHSDRLAARLSAETGHDVLALPFCPLRVPSAEEIRREPRRRGTRRIVTFGSVSVALKRCDLVVEMLGWLRQWGADVELVMVGEGSEQELALIDRLAVESGVADRVTVTGRVDDDEYRRWLVEADLAVQVRNSGLQTNSGAAMDAVAFGVPLVTTESMRTDLFEDAPNVITVPDCFSSFQLAEAAQVGLARDRREAEDERRAFVDARSPEEYAAILAEGLLGS
ncbi:MAG: FkbM family methyltransferase [Ilumatobacter sp.]|nr:FkbM family methyltransferase [Ilumatobacter sp.]